MEEKLSVLSPWCAQITGVLEAIEVKGSAIITVFSCRCPLCNGPKTERVPLPGEYRAELEPLLGKRITILNNNGRYIVKDLQEAVE